MGSEPQFSQHPNLTLAQHIFSLANSASPAAVASRTKSIEYIQNAIRQDKMAPLYRHLAHPVDGVLNRIGEGSAAAARAVSEGPTTSAAGENKKEKDSRQRRASLVSSNLLPVRRREVWQSSSDGTGATAGLTLGLEWNETLYEELRSSNEEELEGFQKEEEEAQEKAGEVEVQAARAKRAEFWARIGDKDKAIEAYETLFEKTGPLGTKIDIVLAIIRVGLFFGDKAFVKRQVERAHILVESGGDWDRRNRLKAYKGLHLLTVRSYNLAAPLLLDSLSTFTSYELCSYSSLIVYSVLAGTLSLKRTDFKAKVVDAPEIKAILGSGEEKVQQDEEMKDVGAATPTPGHGGALVNLTTLGTGSGVETEEETRMDFAPLASLVNSLYNGNYKSFFLALAAVEENFLTQDRYLYEHRAWFVREMRLRAYQQLLQSYRVVGLDAMAKSFGVTVDFLDRDLAKFIAGDRIPCTIDRVKRVIETTRPDDKNKQYADVVRQGDALITKLQKYGQAVRLRGSERS